MNARKAWDMEYPSNVHLGSMNFSENPRMQVHILSTAILIEPDLAHPATP